MLKHYFSSLLRHFPVVTFASSRDWGSCFPYHTWGVRVFVCFFFSKWGVRGVGSPLICTVHCRLHFAFKVMKITKSILVASLHCVCTMFSTLAPSLELHLCGRLAVA